MGQSCVCKDNAVFAACCSGNSPCRFPDEFPNDTDSTTFTDEFGVQHHVFKHQNHEDGYGSASDSEVSCEEDQAATLVLLDYSRKRDNAVFCTKFGEWNRRLVGRFQVPRISKNKPQMIVLEEVIQRDPLFRSAVELQHEEQVAMAFTLRRYQPNETIVQASPWKEANSLHIVLEGSAHCSSTVAGARAGKPARELHVGQYFGDEALLWHTTWSFSAAAGKKGCTMGSLTRTVFQMVVVEAYMREVERRIACLHKCKLFETFNDEQIMKLVEVLHLRRFRKGQLVCREGQIGHHFFIIESGEVKEIEGSNHTATHTEGEMVGEEALFEAGPRKHTLKCKTDVEVLVLSRRKFERLKGPLSELLAEHATSDPRMILSTFFQAGTHHGPRGSVRLVSQKSGLHENELKASSPPSEWFVVFRPVSRDAITKLVSGQGVGKGLNVKGKSAKKGILSGFVPFLQICDNNHKHAIEASPPDSYIKVFYRSNHAREDAFRSLKQVHLAQHEHLHYDRPYGKDLYEDLVTFIDDDLDDAFGLRIPEVLLHEAYIELEDLRPHSGWETGRKSEPAYMDMNLHSVRDQKVKPEVVLWQFDEGHPMNGHGLLIAYQEGRRVMPVVSDFDPFLIGSKGMKYDPLPSEQVDLAKWSLQRTGDILQKPSKDGWTSRWLEVLHDLAEQGEHHDFPPFGYGDQASVELIKAKIHFTQNSGSVRHGAECFNFHFPQELDEEFLIIWEGFLEHWRYVSELELRSFLITRANAGFVFPLNPVWPVRDKGWYDVLEALRAHPATKELFATWYPGDSGVPELIDRLHSKFPNCFEPIMIPQTDPGAEVSCASNRENVELGLHKAKGKATGRTSLTKKPRERADAEAGVCAHSGVNVNLKTQALASKN